MHRRQAVRALILSEAGESVLLLRMRRPDRPGDFWLLPGSGVKRNEDRLDALAGVLPPSGFAGIRESVTRPRRLGSSGITGCLFKPIPTWLRWRDGTNGVSAGNSRPIRLRAKMPLRDSLRSSSVYFVNKIIY